jgi:hypothetical protein
MNRVATTIRAIAEGFLTGFTIALGWIFAFVLLGIAVA